MSNFFGLLLWLVFFPAPSFALPEGVKAGTCQLVHDRNPTLRSYKSCSVPAAAKDIFNELERCESIAPTSGKPYREMKRLARHMRNMTKRLQGRCNTFILNMNHRLCDRLERDAECPCTMHRADTMEKEIKMENNNPWDGCCAYLQQRMHALRKCCDAPGMALPLCVLPKEEDEDEDLDVASVA